MKKCPNCGAQINDDSLFCSECGKPIPQGSICPHCGASVNNGDVFCQSCGKKLNETPTNNSIAYQEDSISRIKKFLPYIVGVVVLLGIIGYYFLNVSPTDNDSQPTVINTIGGESVDAEEVNMKPEQIIEAKKQFLESFYKKYDSSDEYDEAYIKSMATNNALKILKKYNTRGNGGDEDPNGIASWLFNYYNGFATCGAVISRTITPKGGDIFLVSSKYEIIEEYEVEISVIKDGDSYKIDDIKPVGLDKIENDNVSQEDLEKTKIAIGAIDVE